MSQSSWLPFTTIRSQFSTLYSVRKPTCTTNTASGHCPFTVKSFSAESKSLHPLEYSQNGHISGGHREEAINVCVWWTLTHNQTVMDSSSNCCSHIICTLQSSSRGFFSRPSIITTTTCTPNTVTEIQSWMAAAVGAVAIFSIESGEPWTTLH